jgi:hypothetical protein
MGICGLANHPLAWEENLRYEDDSPRSSINDYIHALGPSLQRSRQNRGEPCRLFPADIPSRGSLADESAALDRCVEVRVLSFLWFRL